jgi:hypothetical protein
MNSNLIKFCNTFIYLIFFSKFYSSISLKYPYSLYLSNGKIFVIHQTGISIYDHLMTKKISDILTFSDDDKIKPEDIPKIATILLMTIFFL